MTVVDKALADMREGRRVMVIALARNATRLTQLLDEARGKLHADEWAQHSAQQSRIARRGGDGLIEFRTFGSIVQGGGRGLTLDRVYIDHAALVEEIGPAVQFDPTAFVFL